MGGRLAGAPPGIDNPCPQGYLLFITVAFLEFSEGDSDTIIISSSGGTGNHHGADFVIKTPFELKMGIFLFFIKYMLPSIIFVKNTYTCVPVLLIGDFF